jgi:glycosyltransferase involved in cell wall biosynthesis
MESASFEPGGADGRPTAVVFTPCPWDSACPVLRVRSPLAYAGGRAVEGGATAEAVAGQVAAASVVVIHRDFPRHARAYRRVRDAARARGVPVVYESDDLLQDLPADHPDKAHYLRAALPIVRAVIEADAVTCSTEPLADHFRGLNPNTFVLPNYLDPKLWPARAARRPTGPPVVIGYMGTHTHTVDLLAVAPALAWVLNQSAGAARLQVWGAQPPPELLGRADVEWNPLGLVNYAGFAEFFSRQECDVFIAPLCDTEFNRCKSNLKFLEYSSLGVPGVYSRVHPYAETVAHGDTGFLASGPDEWRRFLSRLVADPDLRARMGARAQQTVRENWMVPGHAARWAEAYAVAARPGGPGDDSGPRRLLERLGRYVDQFEQDLDRKDLLVRCLLHALDEMRQRWETAYRSIAPAA